MSSVYALLGLLGYLYGFWLFYILIMGLYRAHLANQLTIYAKVMAFPVVVIGFLIDWIANWTIAPIVFYEFPKTWKELVTDRLVRYIVEETGYKYNIANWLCTNLLDYFDPRGKHCD